MNVALHAERRVAITSRKNNTAYQYIVLATFSTLKSLIAICNFSKNKNYTKDFPKEKKLTK